MSDLLDDIFVDGVTSDDIYLLAVESSPDGGRKSVFSSERPFWRVSRHELMKMLSLASVLPSHSTLYFCVYRDGECLRVECNNRDCVMNLTLPLVADTTGGNFGNGRYFFELSQLSGFVSAYNDFVFSFDDNDDIYFESFSVLHKLLCYRLDYNLVTMSVPPCPTDTLSFPLSKSHIVVLLGLFASVPVSVTRCVLLPDKCTVNVLRYLYVLRGDLALPSPLVLRNIDIPILSILADDFLELALSDERVYFRVPYGEVSFFRVPYVEDTMPDVDTFAVGDSVGNVAVDVKLMKKALGLSALLGMNTPAKLSVVDSRLRLVLSDASYFDVGSGELSSDVPVNLSLLTKLFKVVPDTEVEISGRFTDSGFDLSFCSGLGFTSVFSVVTSLE